MSTASRRGARGSRGARRRSLIAGRGEEQLAITGVLDAARAGHGGALCLVGEAGIGKSTLLDWAVAELADGWTVTRTSGVETDVAVPYAGLLDLAGPLRGVLDQVPAGQRAALEAALGWSPTGEVTPLLVAAAATTLLSAAATRRPVLVVVDDLPWLDAASAQVVDFARRRLRDDPIAFLLAARDQGPGDVARITLDGLDAADARTLLDGVAPAVRDALVATTAGNPLALLEAAASLTPVQRRGSAALPDTVDLGARLREPFRATVAGLSPSARRTVLLAAAAHRVPTGALVALLRAEDVDADAALDEAAAAGVLLTTGVVSFAHPLQRSAAWGEAGPAERRAAHLALASSSHLDTAVRLRHRIAATSGYDPELSAQVERWWLAEHDRLGYAAGADLLERAADLSPSPARAALLRARAAEEALAAGDVDRARVLADAVLAGRAPPQAQAQALLALAQVEEYAGSVPRSGELLARAADVGAGLVRVRALAELGLVGYRLGDPPALVRAAGRLREVADLTEPEQEMLCCYLTATAAAFSGRWEESREPATRALELLELDPALREDPRYLVTAMTAGVWMGEPERALEFVDRRERRVRETGAIGLLPFALSLLAGGAMALGEHWRAFAYADEAVRLGTELGYAVDVSTAQELLAAQLAARGRPEDATAALLEARRLAAVAGVADAAVQVDLVEAFAALCRGDLPTVVALLEARLAADGGRLPNGDYELAVAPDLVEAYLGLGRADDAVRLAAHHARLHLDSPVPLPRAHARRLVALTAADPEAARAAFVAALEEHRGWPDPFEAARTRLALGSWLRRAGQRREARAELESARAAFDALGFDAWSDRAQGELTASGQRARRGRDPDEALTAQETRVALLVAEGMTNREIAASLFLSPRTVEHHVTAALRKTGVRTRTQLAVALSARPAP